MSKKEETKVEPVFSKGFFAKHLNDAEVSLYISPSCRAYEVCVARCADKTFLLDTLRDIEAQTIVAWSCGTPDEDTDDLLDYFATCIAQYEEEKL